MVNEYDQPVLDEIEHTSNNKEGIKKIIDMAREHIDKLDEEIEGLSAQRNTLMGVISNFNKIYEAVVGTALLDKNEVRHLESQPQKLQNMEAFRGFTIETADRLSSRPSSDGTVNVEDIESTLRNIGEIPWKNPKNAIDTILNRSGKWHKTDPGKWVKMIPFDDD